MDKPTRERTIIVNMNGEQKVYKWIVSEDPGIRETLEQVASSVEEKPASPLWIVSDTSNEKATVEGEKKAKKKWVFGKIKPDKRRLFGIGLPVLVALVTGTVFGIIILKIVLFGGAGEKTPMQQSGLPVLGAVSESEGKPISKERTAFMVQGGVYSSQEAAKERVLLLEGEGYTPIILKQSEQWYIYLGTAGSLEDAKQLAVFFNKKGTETFWKEVEFTGKSGKVYTAAEQKAIKAMLHNVQQYDLVTAKHLMGDKTVAPKTEEFSLEKVPDRLKNMYSLSESMKKLWAQYEQESNSDILMEIQKCTLRFTAEWDKL
ncbi:SPOR domain-containing protein [Pradoshia sp.]